MPSSPPLRIGPHVTHDCGGPCSATAFNLLQCALLVSENLLFVSKGKSALWSHLIQYQERQEKQELLAESPSESKKMLVKWAVSKSEEERLKPQSGDFSFHGVAQFFTLCVAVVLIILT